MLCADEDSHQVAHPYDQKKTLHTARKFKDAMRTLAEAMVTARAHGQVWTLDIYKWIDVDFHAPRLKCFQLT